MPAFRDLTGSPPFGRLTVLQRAPNKGRRTAWVCQCVCGNIRTIDGLNLTSGNTKSCGCLRVEMGRTKNLSHGLAYTAEHAIWHAMNRRCSNPQSKGYANYGGRGIEVCERWRDSFLAFLEDMGHRPSPEHTLDRFPNPDGNYEKTNCRWATYREQNRNMRRNYLVTFQGITQCLTDWAAQLHISPNTLRHRLKKWGSIEKALTTPVELPRDNPTNRLLMYHGVTQCVAAWAEQLHISQDTLRGRLHTGWSVEKILTTPVQLERMRTKEGRFSSEIQTFPTLGQQEPLQLNLPI